MNHAAAYILNKPEPFQSILLHLQLLIEQTIPDAVMLYKYQLPFYYLKRKQPFCYLNQSKNYVDLVFWHATHLTKHTSEMISEGRKHMKSLRYYDLTDINETILREVLSEAYSVSDRKYYK